MPKPITLAPDLPTTTTHNIKPIPTDKIINDLAYADQYIDLLTPRQREFVEEKFTSRGDNWITNGRDFTQKQKEYLDIILIRINTKTKLLHQE